jgi:hypothetical protein
VRRRTHGQLYVLLVIVATTLACGIGGGGGGGGRASGGGISGTALVIGPIDGFGSIIVNGIDFDTTNAQVTLEGDPATVDDLRLGMLVSVRGTVDIGSMTGEADIVAFEDLVEGPVEGVNAADGTFVVLSQLVITDASTVFDQTSIATLMPGDHVEVSGFLDADASVRATRVELKLVDQEIEIKGAISNLDTVGQTFDFNLLTVDFSSALIENAPPGGLANGLFVEVEAMDPPVGDVLTAVGVEVLDQELMADLGDDASVAGFVSEIVSANEFVVNQTQRVRVFPGTRFEGGTASDLVLNARVEVEGSLDQEGALIAEEVEFNP